MSGRATGSMLEVGDLHVAYGRVEAVRGVSLTLAPGQIVSVIGPNGAGKTTLLAAVMGLLPSRGTLRFEGEDLRALDVEARVERGLCLVPEKRELFGELSVLDNLLLGAYAKRLRGPTLPYARAMLAARTVHEWAHLAVDAGWVPLTSGEREYEARVSALVRELDATIAAARPAVARATRADLDERHGQLEVLGNVAREVQDDRPHGVLTVPCHNRRRARARPGGVRRDRHPQSGVPASTATRRSCRPARRRCL